MDNHRAYNIIHSKLQFDEISLRLLQNLCTFFKIDIRFKDKSNLYREYIKLIQCHDAPYSHSGGMGTTTGEIFF